jgi:hypothetical protein
MIDPRERSRHVATPIRHEHGQRSFQRHGVASVFRLRNCLRSRPGVRCHDTCRRVSPRLGTQSQIDTFAANTTITSIRKGSPSHPVSHQDTNRFTNPLHRSKAQPRRFNPRK